jgi:3-dehydroquinate synthase
MHIVPLKLKQNSYSIQVGNAILAQVGKTVKSLSLGTDAVIVTHPVINQLHGKTLVEGLKSQGLSAQIFEVPQGEVSKSADVAFKLLDKIAAYDRLKKIFMIAFGGGVVGDLAGFVAAVYKRGVPYIQVPTTFLAQIDSSIGGKVAIDLSVGKNLVGAFYQPKVVLSDVRLLKTLDERQMRNGLAEAVKYGVIADAAFFRYLEKNYAKVLRRDPKVLTEVVLKCSRIKADVVMRDEKETKNIRTILNFGHTLGHAIEAAGKYKLYHHGESIALGMRMAAYISSELNYLKSTDAFRINQLLSAIGLPAKVKSLSVETILSMMSHDKKFVGGKNRFVLAARIGSVKVVEDIPAVLIERAIRKYM